MKRLFVFALLAALVVSFGASARTYYFDDVVIDGAFTMSGTEATSFTGTTFAIDASSTVVIDGATSVRGVSAGFTSLESPANRIGVSATIYMQIATTAVTGVTAITHTGSAPTVTWTANSFDFVGALAADGVTISGAVGMADDQLFTIGTTTATAETKITAEFDETTTGVGAFYMGSSGVPQVLNTNPGAAVIPFSINILHSAGAGDCDDLIGAYLKSQVTGDGDTGLTAVGAAPRFTVGTNGGTTAISQGYATQSHFIHRGTGAITAGSAGSFKTVLGVDSFTVTNSLNALQAILEGESGTPTITGQLDVAWLHAESTAYDVDSILRMSNTNSVTAGIDMSGVVATSDIVLQNGETISNATDGEIDFSSASLQVNSQPVVLNTRHRVTVAEINAGHEILPAITGRTYRIIDVKAIAYGGAVGTTTTVDVLGTQGTASVKLVTFAQADLTQSAVLTDATDGTVLADGASYTACDAASAITVGKTGGDADTATGVDFIITYVIE